MTDRRCTGLFIFLLPFSLYRICVNLPVFIDAAGHNLVTVGEVIGTASNNEAEYRALDSALELVLLMMGVHRGKVQIYCDSQLLVRHITGEYVARADHIIALLKGINDKVKKFTDFDIKHVLRCDNTEADLAANKALDDGSSLVVCKKLLAFNSSRAGDSGDICEDDKKAKTKRKKKVM